MRSKIITRLTGTRNKLDFVAAGVEYARKNIMPDCGDYEELEFWIETNRDWLALWTKANVDCLAPHEEKWLNNLLIDITEHLEEKAPRPRQRPGRARHY